MCGAHWTGSLHISCHASLLSSSGSDRTVGTSWIASSTPPAHSTFGIPPCTQNICGQTFHPLHTHAKHLGANISLITHARKTSGDKHFTYYNCTQNICGQTFHLLHTHTKHLGQTFHLLQLHAEYLGANISLVTHAQLLALAEYLWANI